MKLLIVLLALVCAVSAYGPFYGRRYGYGAPRYGYTGYGVSRASYYRPSRYAYRGAYRHKRDADPEPEADAQPDADADADPGYVSFYNNPYAYRYPYPAYVRPTTFYSSPLYHTYGTTTYHYRHRRDADPEPEADAQPDADADAEPGVVTYGALPYSYTRSYVKSVPYYNTGYYHGYRYGHPAYYRPYYY